MPRPHAHRKFEEWTKEYGPLFTLRQGRNIIVIIGRYQAAVDILEKEGANTVDRPRSIAAGETLSGGMRTLLAGAGDRIKKLRRALHSQLQQKVSETYEPIQMANAKNVVLDILDSPSEHQSHAKRYAASVVMSVTYGKTTPTSYSDPVVQEVQKCLVRLGVTLTPGKWMVDAYPILRYVPGYLTTLRQWHKEELALFKGQLDGVRKQMDSGQARPSFAKYLLERQTEYDLTDDELAYLAGSMFGAGSDTSAAAITIAIMAAATHPEAQAKVQEELDSVVGRDRLPTFGDMDMLPQTMAFVLETFRWRPVSAGGFGHKATKDIFWKNYCIPKGATIIGNHWSIGRDPVVFPDPESFKPPRWIGEDGQIRNDLKFYNFGFGRRVCPGQHLAVRSVFINTALILWAFKIFEDPHKPIDTLAFTDTANVHPLPFEVKFVPRMGRLREMIEEHVE
ncbi:cytochrome P450 [Gloeophyllum trabeum ATCC 11539]|uniref:Cytochrome P450 n=1 Tax=Gloeophyllum trabeum (strain ATCC 11539 / FP-39264 / Madison 617) TaxID=670483 RepID=S7PSF6_GLOTA|nr:cytochrome P450 [Gloeophyllum trabeum ATCC 11539]EPQ50746.1 cytochrome P450 [Gloeophyllum trabeum ATCC 11539]